VRSPDARSNAGAFRDALSGCQAASGMSASTPFAALGFAGYRSQRMRRAALA